MALHRRKEFWIICNARDTPLYLLLFGTSGYFAVQERLISINNYNQIQNNNNKYQ